MSWSGPAGGAASYQAQPFGNGQPAYGQQQSYQYVQQQPAYQQHQSGVATYLPNSQTQRPLENRPPKKKGNPVITRYPPPPGYVPPNPPQGGYGPNQYPNQYQAPPQGYPQSYAGAPNYSNQPYSAPPQQSPNQGYSPQGYPPSQGWQPPNYQHNGYPQGQNYPYPQQGYPPNQPYSQAPGYPAHQGYPPQQGSYQGYPPQSGPVDANQAAYAQSQQGWQPPNGQPPYDPYNAQAQGWQPPVGNQDPNATPTPASAYPVANQETPTQANPQSATAEKDGTEKPQLFLAWDDWDFDFDGAIWPKSNEPVDPNLSLGVIIWHPAKQVTRALPSNFTEAEEQSLQPPAEKLGNGESVSRYFTLDNSHEAFLDVRQTDDWDKIKHDPIFVVFPDEKEMDLIPLEECISKRDRPDVHPEETVDEEDEDMQDSSWNVMDNLEQALSGQDNDDKPPPSRKASEAPRNQSQEDILAKLGVTGSPKPPSNDPMPFPVPPAEDSKPQAPPPSLPQKPPVAPPPASLQSQPPPKTQAYPEPPQRAHSYGGHRNSNYGPAPLRPYGSMSSTGPQARPPPPPPPPPERKRSQADHWAASNSQNYPNKPAFDGSRGSPARSEASNNTVAGSDFDEKPGDCASTDKVSAEEPKLHRSDSSISRKRSYDDGEHDDKIRQQDDNTRRKRRQPEVAAAYSRR